MQKIKTYVLPCLTFLAAVYFFSLMFSIGMIVGYLGTILFHKKLIATKRIRKQININLGKWKFRFHHWLMGLAALFLIWICGITNYVPVFCYGAIGGIIFHDFFGTKGWYLLFTRK